MYAPSLIKPITWLSTMVCLSHPAWSQDVNSDAAAVAGQAAANYAFHVGQCAKLAGDIPREVVDEVISQLAWTRQFYIGAEYAFDLNFELQYKRAETGEVAIEVNEENCISIISTLRFFARNGF